MNQYCASLIQIGADVFDENFKTNGKRNKKIKKNKMKYSIENFDDEQIDVRFIKVIVSLDIICILRSFIFL